MTPELTQQSTQTQDLTQDITTLECLEQILLLQQDLEKRLNKIIQSKNEA
jgi:hypothetical protein